MRENTKVTLIAVICALLFGMSFLGTKVALDVMSPLQLLASRWTFALAAFLVLLATGRVKVRFKGKPVRFVILMAFLQPCVYATFETWGINLTTMGESAIILAIMPVFVTAVSVVIFRIQVGPVTMGAVILAFVGVVVTVVFSKEAGYDSRFLGYLFLGIAVIAGASYSFLSGRISDRFSPMELTFVMAVTGSVVFNALAFATGEGLETYVVLFSSPSMLLSVAYLGVFCSLISFVMLNYVLARMPAHKASAITMNLITLTGVASGVIFRGEVLYWNTLLGMVLILLGVIGVNIGKDQVKSNVGG